MEKGQGRDRWARHLLAPGLLSDRPPVPVLRSMFDCKSFWLMDVLCSGKFPGTDLSCGPLLLRSNCWDIVRRIEDSCDQEIGHSVPSCDVDGVRCPLLLHV